MSRHTSPVLFLLAEDDDDHADLVARAMRDAVAPSEVVHVGDGEEALKFLRREGAHVDARRPDVVLLDLKMPRVDGHQVLEAIKTDPDLKTIPVVVMTTSQAEADRARAYGAHVNSYLVKPMDFDRFNSMVQELQTYWAGLNEPPA